MAIHVDVIPILKDRDVQREADKLANDFDTVGQRAGSRFGDGFATGIQKASPKIQKSFNTIEAATIRAAQAQREYNKLHSDMGPQTEASIRAAERLTIARNAEADAHRNAAAVLRQHTQAARDSDSAMENITQSLQVLGTQAFKTGRGIATIAAPAVIAALWETGRVAVTASQSLAALPAVAVAAAAGMGTLHIATSGFNQAMKDIGDFDKFNAALVNLGPNAAQAALEIRNNFLPVFDQIQRAAEDKLFVGVAQRLEQLKTAFAPGIQGLTSSIAASFNQMALSATGTLLSPQNMAAIDATMSNISDAFSNAAPAAGMFTQAMVELINVGSQFLPDLGTSITDMAADFSAFISRVASSGELHDFIADGIESAKALGGAVVDIGKFVYDTFGGVSQSEVQAWSNQVKDALTTISILVWPINEAFKIMNTNILNTGQSLSDLVNPLTTVVNAVNALTGNADDAKQNATDRLNEARARMGQPPVDVNGNVMPGQRPVPSAPKYAGGQLGFDPFPTTPSGLPVMGSTILNPPVGASGAKPPKPSDRERLDAIRAGLDPSLYKVDPFAPVAGMPSPGSLYGGPMPGGGYGAASGSEFFEGQQKIITAGHALEETRKDVLALERDNESTAEQISDAKWKRHQDEVDLWKAQVDLVEKTKGTARDMKKGMDDLGVALDPDLGLSKGLAGFADNLVRFVGSLAFAGTAAKLQNTINEGEAQYGITGGYGLLGMRGANNLAAGLSPLLGNPMPGGAGLSSPTSNGLSGIGSGSTSTASGGYAGDAALLANVPAGKYDSGAKNLAQGLADCSSSVEDLVNLMDGRSTVGGSLTTHNAAQLLPGMGFVPGIGGPGDFRIGYNSGHMQATLPGGTPWNWGSNSAAARGGVGGTGADDPSLTDHWYRPGGGSTNPLLGTGGSGSLGPGGGVVPVYVTNFGGGGGAIPGAGGKIQGAFSVPGAGAGAEGWRSTVAQVISQYGSQMGIAPQNAKAWEDAIVKQIDFESKGDPGADNPNDSNGQGGRQHVSGLLQYLPSSYANSGGKLTGRPYMDPVGQIAGALFAPRTAGGLPDTSATGGIGAGHGWGPTSYNPTMGGGSTNVNNPTMGGGPTSVPPALGGGQGGGPGPSIPGITSGGIGTGLGNAPSIAGTGPTQIGGLAPIAPNPGGQGIGIMPGGTIDSLIQGGLQAAGGAAGGFGGGAGGAAAAAAAQTIMKLANRAIQFGGQAAGIGVSGLMETFLPTGGSELANNNWLTRIAGGVAAAAPALPNLAGGALGEAQQQGPLTPEQVAANKGGGLGGALGQQINVTQNNEHTGPLPAEQSAAAIADNVRTANAAPMAGAGGPPR